MRYETLRDAVTMYAGDGLIADDDVIRMATEHAQVAAAVVPENCLCAALQMPDGYVVRGHRHDDCIMTAAFYKRYAKGDVHQAVMGFLTTHGRFVDRVEGAAVQQFAGIVCFRTKRFTDYLFSEDLY